MKYSKNKEDAEDVLQDSFVTIFNKIHQYKNKGSFEGWLKRIAINTALQKYREKATLYLVTDEIQEPSEVVVEEESMKIKELLHFIQKLPDRYRLVFNLYVLDNYSHKEIATMLQISEGTSKSNLSRARQLLKKNIESYTLQSDNA